MLYNQIVKSVFFKKYDNKQDNQSQMGKKDYNISI